MAEPVVADVSPTNQSALHCQREKNVIGNGGRIGQGVSRRGSIKRGRAIREAIRKHISKTNPLIGRGRLIFEQIEKKLSATQIG